MGIKFNADEIFKIAEKIERNGAAFYKKAADRAKDNDAAKILKDLAQQEEAHEKIFSLIHSELPPSASKPVSFDPNNEVEEYLGTVADGYVFDLNKNPIDLISGSESPSDVLKVAIGLEKDSVVFYAGIRDLVLKNAGAEKIDAIIREELKHITILSRELKKISNR